ncbi:TaqI-like C-terminal specificity domain-containing protein, partial [Helicobacter japonicus]|uniref:TaqI-like C-terminal specificity domain-containing protein n=1 Tax=Helicobacter japonicus TaxID=425400 RepID=UPI0023F2C329
QNCTLKQIPNIAKHLAIFKEIMDNRRENISGRLNFFHLHWARDERFFKQGSKILCVRKCIDTPIFSYTENEAYVMLSLNIIQTNRINLKFLTGLLNSKLIAFWLKHKGKMQGNNYQIDKEPLMNIPLIEITKQNEKNTNQIIALVDEILKLKTKDSTFDISKLELQIDKLVYKLYDLTDEEIQIIES